VILVEPQVFEDRRGFFFESYKESDFAGAGLPNFVQENHSRSTAGTLRGLHYQLPPKAQGKLVRVIAGEIFDVAADVRPQSPTYGKWLGIRLSAENRKMLYIPKWYAHGFCVVSDEAEVIYKTTAEYEPDLERGVLWNDPTLGIEWPTDNPNLSQRDRRWPLLKVN